MFHRFGIPETAIFSPFTIRYRPRGQCRRSGVWLPLPGHRACHAAGCSEAGAGECSVIYFSPVFLALFGFGRGLGGVGDMKPDSVFFSFFCDPSPVFFMLIHNSVGLGYFSDLGGGGGTFGGADGTYPKFPCLEGGGGGGTKPSVIGFGGGVGGLSFAIIFSFCWPVTEVSMFLELKMHKRMTPKTKLTRDVQLSQLVSLVNHLGKLRAGALR